ncbi:MAG TPA: hypothetical protein VFP12_10835 [Allosphingosinicella sp.]|nr:hypothetical protein [Allosphingosinicella sp.]
MPTTAQDRVSRAPLAALLVLLSLFLASGTAATANSDLRAPARLGPSRHAAASAIVPSGTRSSLDDEPAGAGPESSVPPSAPGIVTERIGTRPSAGQPSAPSAAIPRPAVASYRARAPPAS